MTPLIIDTSVVVSIVSIEGDIDIYYRYLDTRIMNGSKVLCIDSTRADNDMDTVSYRHGTDT